MTVGADANGNLTSQGGYTYTYNARNQLTTVMQGTNTRYSAVADPLGRLARYAIGSSTTRPVFDGWNAVQERAQNGSVRANLLTGLGLDQVFLRTTSSQRELLSDALGSTVAEADTTGVVATSYTYEPYGRTTASGAGGGLYQFTGRENHSNGALALYNLRNRYYSPTFGRFLTQDPIGFAGDDVNLYGYVSNAPSQRTDPSGLIGGPMPPYFWDDYAKYFADNRKDTRPESCGNYVKLTIGFLIFAASVYKDDCGFHLGGSVQASLLPLSGSLTVSNTPISCSSANLDAYYGFGAEIGAGETNWRIRGYEEAGIGTPNASWGMSGVWHCPNG